MGGVSVFVIRNHWAPVWDSKSAVHPHPASPEARHASGGDQTISNQLVCIDYLIEQAR
jgi:hypothetical protein